MAEALTFYTGQLEFTLDSGGEGATNSSLTRGDGHLMIETASDFYGDQYNEAIRERLGTPSSTALYIEAEDLAAFHARLKANGSFGSSIALLHDPGVRRSSPSRTLRVTG
jgi:hypothetical protein